MTAEAIQEVLQESSAIITRLNSTIEELRPAAEFGMAIMGDDTTYSMNDAAKVLHEKVLNEIGLDLGQNKLFEFLRKHRILLSTESNWNIPTQDQINANHFVIVLKQTSVGPKRTPRVTGKGVAYIMKKLGEYYHG